MPFLSFIVDFLTQYLLISAFLPHWQTPYTVKQGAVDVPEKIDKYLEESIQSRSYQSDDATQNFPYFASLWHCSAAIISDQWVLTAAHCVNGVHLVDEVISVGAGSYEDGEKIPIDQVVPHPWFLEFDDILINDIALVKLAEPLTFNDKVQPIILSDYDYYDETHHALVGIGGYENDNVTEMGMTRVPTELCYATSYSEYYWYLAPFVGLLDRMTLCGVRQGYSAQASPGEGSGSLLMSDGDLVGILSHGVPLPEREDHRVVFFTKIANYLPWIESVTGLQNLNH